MDVAPRANSLQVRVELQADSLCWRLELTGGHAKWDFIEPGDVDSALQTVHPPSGMIDCKRQSQGYVVPDAFTHGTSAQRFAVVHDRLEIGRCRELRHIPQ